MTGNFLWLAMQYNSSLGTSFIRQSLAPFPIQGYACPWHIPPATAQVEPFHTRNAFSDQLWGRWQALQELNPTCNMCKPFCLQLYHHTPIFTNKICVIKYRECMLLQRKRSLSKISKSTIDSIQISRKIFSQPSNQFKTYHWGHEYLSHEVF